MKKIKGLLIASLVIIACAGCKDDTWAQYHSLGTRHKVSLYSGGKLVRQWISTGNVSSMKLTEQELSSGGQKDLWMVIWQDTEPPEVAKLSTHKNDGAN